MRILYVTNECPFMAQGGGISTYIGFTARAMAAAGHEVYLLTWSDDPKLSIEIGNCEPFKKEAARLIFMRGADVWARFPHGPYQQAVSQILAAEIARCVADWSIDVVEATDYLSPAMSYFLDAQSGSAGRDILCVSYNHGFIEDFYDADQVMPTPGIQSELTAERQQLRASDLVIAPSVTAKRRLASYDIIDNVAIVREPYLFAKSESCPKAKASVTYIGRISISKGIDKLILLTNVIDEIHPVDDILLIGRTIDPPFRTSDIKTYVRNRLKLRLRDSVMFTGMLKRSQALGLLRPGCISPNLGSAETFSYACIETIDYGLLPVVRHGTPMAEFFPADLADCVFDEHLSDSRQVQRTFEHLAASAPKVVARLQEHNAAELDPTRIADHLGTLYDRGLRAKKGYSTVSVRLPATFEDVTIIMPVCKPGEIFATTIDSICAQTAGVPQVLICDDGTPDDNREWFSYADLRVPHCRILRQPNSGLLGSRNTLVREAATRLSVFLDDDDILAPTFLERTLEAYNHSPLAPNAVITQRHNFSESDEKVIRHFYGDHIHFIRNDYRMTALIETAILREIGFDPTRRNGEGDDWAFWLAFHAAGYCAVMVPELLFHYRFRSGSMSWPWSMGQSSGTSSMIRDELVRLSRRRPRQAASVARALFAKTNTLDDRGVG